MSSTKTNEIWKHFSYSGENHVQCMHCLQIFKFTKRSTTSNLKRHMKTKHETIPISSKEINIIADDVETESEHEAEEEESGEQILIFNEKMYPKKSSEIWGHFSECGGNRVECVHCRKILKFTNRSTCNLIRHMKAIHKTIPLYRNTIKSNIEEVETESQHETEESSEQIVIFEEKLSSSDNNELWDHFFESGQNKAECMYCSQVLTFSDQSVSNLIQHMKIKHGTICNHTDKINSKIKKVEKSQQEIEDSVEQILTFTNEASSRKTSGIWKHFSESGQNKVKCLYCRKILKFTNRATSNLIRHMKSKHGTIPIFENKVNTKVIGFETESQLETEDSEEQILIFSEEQSSRRNSEIWNHFAESGENEVKCMHCSKILKISNRSTSNLIRHMKSKHGTIPLYTNQNNDVEMVEIESDHDETDIEAASISCIDHSNDNDKNDNNTPHDVKDLITEFVTFHKSIPVEKSQEFDRQLVKMLVKEYYPLRTVEEPEFRTFVNMLCPEYNLPSKKTVAYSLIPELFNSLEQRLKEKINLATAVCITTDEWTSINNEEFTAITAHFLNNNTNLESNLLCCISYNKSHTPENLYQLLKEKIREWNLEHKVTAIVSGNTGNMTAAIKLGKWKYLPCFAHKLNAIVQTGLKYNRIKTIVDKVKTTVEFFKKSSSALSKLQSVQEGMGLPKLKLKPDVPTRWNSTYDMLSHILEVKDTVISTLSIVNSELNIISSYEWVAIEQVRDILQIFLALTNEISTEKVTQVSKLIVFTNILKNRLNIYFTNEKPFTPVPEVQDMILVLKDQINVHLKYFEENEICLQATLLDPRFKTFGFPTPEKYNLAYTSLTREISSIQPTSSYVKSSTSKSELGSLLWHDFDKEVSCSKSPVNSSAAAIIEVDYFLKEPVINRNENPLVWWNDRKEQYPRLYDLVVKRFCIVGTSVPCERVFSKMGQIVNEKRSRLTTSRISQIVFLNENLK